MEIFNVKRCEDGHELHRVLTGFRKWKSWNRLIDGQYLVKEVCAACGKGVSLTREIECCWCIEKLLCSCRP